MSEIEVLTSKNDADEWRCCIQRVEHDRSVNAVQVLDSVFMSREEAAEVLIRLMDVLGERKELMGTAVLTVPSGFSDGFKKEKRE
jgi:hypothetical protein